MINFNKIPPFYLIIGKCFNSTFLNVIQISPHYCYFYLKKQWMFWFSACFPTFFAQCCLLSLLSGFSFLFPEAHPLVVLSERVYEWFIFSILISMDLHSSWVWNSWSTVLILNILKVIIPSLFYFCFWEVCFSLIGLFQAVSFLALF